MNVFMPDAKKIGLVSMLESISRRVRTAIQGKKGLLTFRADDELRVRSRHDDFAPLAVLDLVNVHFREG